ncbi:MAG: DUF3072 domain-containing protein [Stellaceae bacterium]
MAPRSSWSSYGWVTGKEQVTGARRSYLHTLAQKAHEPSIRISRRQGREGDRLQRRPNAGGVPAGSAPRKNTD